MKAHTLGLPDILLLQDLPVFFSSYQSLWKLTESSKISSGLVKKILKSLLIYIYHFTRLSLVIFQQLSQFLSYWDKVNFELLG